MAEFDPTAVMERLDEIKADLEKADSLRAAGVLGIVDHYLQWHPGLTRDQAIEEMIRNAEEEAMLKRRIAALMPAPPPIPPPVRGRSRSTRPRPMSSRMPTMPRRCSTCRPWASSIRA